MKPRSRFTSSILLTLTIFLTSVGTVRAQDPGDVIFAGIKVYTIRFQFQQQNFWDSLMYYHALGTEEYMLAHATIDGEPFDSIGVRLKGNSSYTYPGTKKSIRIDFGEYRDGLRWDGVKAVHLNNGWGDPSFMREKIFLDFCRDAGIAAPRANFARVYINDSLWGLYSLIEHVDKRFLKNHYGKGDGDLFKAVDNFDPGGPGQKIFSDFKWYGAVDTSYLSRYEMKTDESTTAWPRLIAFIDSLNNHGQAGPVLGAKCNLPALYGAIATDNLFGNLDSYIGSGRNFYFYFHPVTGKMEWIAWDTGLSFGVYSAGVSRAETMNCLYVSSAADRPLIGSVFSDTTLRREYLLTLCALFNGFFTTARLYPHIDSVANIIRPHVIDDPRKMYSVQQFESNIAGDINADGGGGVRKPGLKSFITARRTSVQTQLTTLGIDCALGVAEDPVATPSRPDVARCFPNPAAGTVTLLTDMPSAQHLRIALHDALGRSVAAFEREHPDGGPLSLSFDASTLPAGTYIYTISGGTSVRTGRMLVTR